MIALQCIITVQYNSDILMRTPEVQSIGESSDCSDSLCLTGPPMETYKLKCEIDTTDQLMWKKHFIKGCTL